MVLRFFSRFSKPSKRRPTRPPRGRAGWLTHGKRRPARDPAEINAEIDAQAREPGADTPVRPAMNISCAQICDDDYQGPIWDANAGAWRWEDERF